MSDGELMEKGKQVGRTAQQIEAEVMQVVQAMREAKARRKSVVQAFGEEIKGMEAKLNDLCGQREAIKRPNLPGIA